MVIAEMAPLSKLSWSDHTNCLLYILIAHHFDSLPWPYQLAKRHDKIPHEVLQQSASHPAFSPLLLSEVNWVYEQSLSLSGDYNGVLRVLCSWIPTNLSESQPR